MAPATTSLSETSRGRAGGQVLQDGLELHCLVELLEIVDAFLQSLGDRQVEGFDDVPAVRLRVAAPMTSRGGPSARGIAGHAMTYATQSTDSNNSVASLLDVSYHGYRRGRPGIVRYDGSRSSSPRRKRLNQATTLGAPTSNDVFRHEALFCAGLDDFVDRTSSFIRDAVSADEAILVVVSAAKIDLLRSELGRDADKVRFADMAEVGLNPARIIPAWRDFVAEQAPSGRRFRGIGEPIWAERTLDELVECERHEALLNLAFAGAPAWWLVCPYDTEALDPAVLEESHRTHPSVLNGEGRRSSATYRNLAITAKPFDRPLPEPPHRPQEMTFATGALSDVRTFVSRFAAAHGLKPERVCDLVMAVNEVVTNSLRYGGGAGVLRMWQKEGTLICEVRDEGRIDDPMVGRTRPTTLQESGLGLWLANQLCDLLQVRTFASGSVVRLHLSA